MFRFTPVFMIIILALSCSKVKDQIIRPGDLVPGDGPSCESLVLERTMNLAAMIEQSYLTDLRFPWFSGIAHLGTELAFVISSQDHERNVSVLFHLDLENLLIRKKQSFQEVACDLEWNGRDPLVLVGCDGNPTKLVEINGEQMIELYRFEGFSYIDAFAVDLDKLQAWLYADGSLYSLANIVPETTPSQHQTKPYILSFFMISDITIDGGSLLVTNNAFEVGMPNLLEHFHPTYGQTECIYDIENVDGLKGTRGLKVTTDRNYVWILSADGVLAEFQHLL